MGRLKYLIDRHEYYFWDPLAAALAAHEEIGEYGEMELKVIAQEGLECGRTLLSAEGHAVRVCTGVDAESFEQIFLDTLNYH